uniref:Aquaporin 8a, tandem duplicate 1 n=1 Tax=Neogobius melanostomus TaxID=47308 RepID=A0A8C6S758_9GOBI
APVSKYKTDDQPREQNSLVNSIGSFVQCTNVYEQYVQPVLAEFYGSTLFIFVGCACVVGNTGTGAIQPAVAHGLALGVVTWGHFNPAVTLSVYLCGGMSLRLVVLPNVLAQMAGGMAGAGLVKAMFPPEVYQASSGGAFKPQALAKPWESHTCRTCDDHVPHHRVTMGAVNRKTSSQMAPFGIGLTVAANILAGALSGACMNPARAFGPAVAANHWDHHWIYWVGPLSGALSIVIYVRLVIAVIISGQRIIRIYVSRARAD